MLKIDVVPLVWALDAETHRKVIHQKIGTIPMSSIYSQQLLLQQSSFGKEVWNKSTINTFKVPGGSQYMAAVAFKPLVMREVLKHGFDVLFVDVDVALIKDPRPWLRQHNSSDIQISMNYPQANVNTGVFYARGGDKGSSFTLVGEWAQEMMTHNCSGWECGESPLFCDRKPLNKGKKK